MTSNNKNNNNPTTSKPWYHVNDNDGILLDGIDIELLSLPLPSTLSLEKLHDTVSSYFYVANESRILATKYQHQLQCERTRHSFSIELLEKQLEEAKNNYQNETKLRLQLENELNTCQMTLYQRNEYLTKQDKIIRHNEEGLDRANNRITNLEEKLENIETEYKTLKVYYQKEQIDHSLTIEKLNNEIVENEQKSLIINELKELNKSANEKKIYLEHQINHDHVNLVSLTNNYSIITDRYEELCKHAKGIDRWIENALSYIGISPEICDSNEDQVELSYLEDRESGDNSIVSIANSKTISVKKHMKMIRSICRDQTLKTELELIFKRIEELTNEEINILFTKKRLQKLIVQHEVSRHFNHFWIDFASNKDEKLQEFQLQCDRLKQELGIVSNENKKFVDQAIENNTEKLLSTLLMQTQQIKELIKTNANKDKIISRNKMAIEKLKGFENDYHTLKIENDQNIKTIDGLRITVEQLNSTIDNKDAARADENQNSIIIQNLVIALNREIDAFKNRLSYDAKRDDNDAKRDDNPLLLQSLEVVRGTTNKLNTFEKSLIYDSFANIEALWGSIDNVTKFKSNYNSVVSNIKDVTSELHDTKSFAIRENRRMSTLYENKLEELRNNSSANEKLKREMIELEKSVAQKDKTIAALTTEINRSVDAVLITKNKYNSQLSNIMNCTVIWIVLLFRLMTIHFSTPYIPPHNNNNDNKDDNNNDKDKKKVVDDKEYKELTDQLTSVQMTLNKLLQENERLIKEKRDLVKFKEHFIDSLDKSSSTRVSSTFESINSDSIREISDDNNNNNNDSIPETASTAKTYSSWKAQKNSFLGKRLDKLDKIKKPDNHQQSLSKVREQHVISVQVVNSEKVSEPSTPSPSKKTIRYQKEIQVCIGQGEYNHDDIENLD